MNNAPTFRTTIREAFESILNSKRTHLFEDDLLRIDLHCHDFNSDVPDELWGRILRLPETWLTTEELMKCLNIHNVDGFTVTNHNNATSCWQMLEKGLDVLPGAEFTCYFPEYDVYVHVLAYGFTPLQEEILNKKRHNIYTFLAFTHEYNIPTILPHPLYFYKRHGQPPMELFEKFALLFERFEVLNGQRDGWQNLLTLEWVEGLTEEKLRHYSKKHGIYPTDFCHHPYRKRLTGGSDDHMGIFAGSCGTVVRIPNLEEKLRNYKVSELILDELRNGELVPYGSLAEEEKLNIAFLDYFCQVGLNMEDPGLIRMFLHHGTLKDKLACLAISNGMQELKRHKYTSKFLSAFHDAFLGKRPSLLTKMNISREYKPLLNKIDHIASVRKKSPEHLLDEVQNFVPDMFKLLVDILVHRIEKTIIPKLQSGSLTWVEIIKGFELPSHLRTLFKTDNSNTYNFGAILDKLSFPSLISGILALSSLASTRVLYSGRPLLNRFAKHLNKYQHPERILWLTDTFYDKNGVSSVLQQTLKEVQENNYPIDFLICQSKDPQEEHLHVVKPLTSFSFPSFGEQEFRIPNILDIHKIFINGGYDRIMCSTEFLMGAVGLFLKESFHVPIYFFMHTDWLEYFERSVRLNTKELDRVRRMLRAYYKQFDRLFVLNSDHKHWLTGTEMDIEPHKVFTTAHWADPIFKRRTCFKTELYTNINEDEFVLLYSGRLSQEKGVYDLPKIYQYVVAEHPNAKLVIAGTGPEEDELKRKMPYATFLGWVDKHRMVDIYSTADLLLLPSTFDTFGCVVLEAMQCGCPVAAYNLKGPKDIITQNVNGLLEDNVHDLSLTINEYFSNTSFRDRIKQHCIERTNIYNAQSIMKTLLANMDISEAVTTENIFQMTI